MYILCDYYVFGLSGIASDLHAVLLPLKLVQTRFGDFAKATLPKLQVIEHFSPSVAHIETSAAGQPSELSEL